jgi:hypothetical protein
MLTVVTYLWGTRRYRPQHVQRLAESVRCWLDLPHRFVCITSKGPIAGVKTLADPRPSLIYPGRCYRRLWLFSPEARGLGDTILHLDLDVVICGPLAPLVTRGKDFSIYKAGSIAAKGYSLNPSVMVIRAGTQPDIWDAWRAHPGRLAVAANHAGFWGSDQAVISFLRMNSAVDTISDAEGVVSFRRIRHEGLTEPPPGTRIVSFHGKRTPFENEIQRLHPWIRATWESAA